MLTRIYDSHFNKILLAFLFLATVFLAIHLIHKQDAGGDDAGMIVWAETQAAFILGKLLAVIVPDTTKKTDVGDGKQVGAENP